MADFDADVARGMAELSGDRSSGASGLVQLAVRLIQDVRSAGRAVAPVATALCAAQPSMAPIWRVAAEALASEHDPVRFDRFVARLDRSGRALVQVATAHLSPPETKALRVATLSASGSVRAVIDALARHLQVHVACSESRPALEGRALATHLAATGVPVTLFSDAAIAHALADADAVLVGADAVAPSWILNKSGTLMLAAAAAHRGVPVYVLATRDKFVPEDIARRLAIREEPADEIWDAPATAVAVRNPYFERTPADLVTAVISDIGVLSTDMLPDACASAVDRVALAALIAQLD